MDTFLNSILFSAFISSINFGHTQYFPIIWFNICFFLNSWYNGHSSKNCCIMTQQQNY